MGYEPNELPTAPPVSYTHLYLPEHSGKYWYDFWTGEAFEGGREQMQTSILDILPLYVKAGSILPLAEVKQYAMEYPDRELELRIYGGADASFCLLYTSYNEEDQFISSFFRL